MSSFVPTGVSQYTSGDFGALARANGVVLSVGRKGECWDKDRLERLIDRVHPEIMPSAMPLQTDSSTMLSGSDDDFSLRSWRGTFHAVSNDCLDELAVLRIVF